MTRTGAQPLHHVGHRHPRRPGSRPAGRRPRATSGAAGAFRYSRNCAILTCRRSPDAEATGAVWSSWNLRGDGEATGRPVCVTYWMNQLQNLDPAMPLFVTLNPTRARSRQCDLRDFAYEHPQCDGGRRSRRSGSSAGCRGARNTLFCGSYFGSGFHEDALVGAGRGGGSGGVRRGIRPWRRRRSPPENFRRPRNERVPRASTSAHVSACAPPAEAAPLTLWRVLAGSRPRRGSRRAPALPTFCPQPVQPVRFYRSRSRRRRGRCRYGVGRAARCAEAGIASAGRAHHAALLPARPRLRLQPAVTVCFCHGARRRAAGAALRGPQHLRRAPRLRAPRRRGVGRHASTVARQALLRLAVHAAAGRHQYRFRTPRRGAAAASEFSRRRRRAASLRRASAAAAPPSTTARWLQRCVRYPLMTLKVIGRHPLGSRPAVAKGRSDCRPAAVTRLPVTVVGQRIPGHHA